VLVDRLIERSGAWFGEEKEGQTVVSSRVRLARNLGSSAFPDWAGEEERKQTWTRLREALGGLSSLAEPLFLDMGELDPVDREVLRERRLISAELSGRGEGSGVAVSGDEGVAVMVNEEDHLRLQAIGPGLDLAKVWARLDDVDTELEKHIDYAFSDRLGYLTACPTNVGTGLRASVMMRLIGLAMGGEADAVVKGLDRLGFEVRGVGGEGTDAGGALYQVSNRSTLGETEKEIIDRMTGIAEEVARHETNARLRLVERSPVLVLDRIGRAYGTLTHARVVASREGADLLSAISLGIEFGLVDGIEAKRVGELMLLTQPGHLQKMAGKPLSPQERDETRAELFKKEFSHVTLKG